MSNAALNVIEKEIETVRQEIKDNEAELDVCKQNIALAQDRLAVLVDLQRKVQEAISQQAGQQPVETSQSAPVRLGARKGVLSLLQSHGPLTKKEIVDALEHRITTESDLPRRVLTQTVLNLVNAGRIVKEGDTYRLAKIERKRLSDPNGADH